LIEKKGLKRHRFIVFQYKAARFAAQLDSARHAGRGNLSKKLELAFKRIHLARGWRAAERYLYDKTLRISFASRPVERVPAASREFLYRVVTWYLHTSLSDD
jgi:hypothetical protein